MTSRPRSPAAVFRATSSATGTLSLKSMTETPASSASKASAVALEPGTEMRARFASPARTAERSVRGGGGAPKPPDEAPADRSAASVLSTAARPAARALSSTARTATMRSFGIVGSSAENPIPPISSRLSSVAIATRAAVTPGVAPTSRETCMRLTESTYTPCLICTISLMVHILR